MQNCSRCEKFLRDVCYYGHSLSLLRGYCNAGSVCSNSPSSAILLLGLIAPVADHESDYAESAYGAQKPPVVAPSGSRCFVDEVAMGPPHEGRSRQSADAARQQGKQGLALGADGLFNSSGQEDFPGLEEIGPADPVQGDAEQDAGKGIIRSPQGIEQVAQGSACQGENKNGLDTPIPQKNLDLAKKYGVTATPVLVITDTEGVELEKKIGGLNITQSIRKLYDKYGIT